LLSSPSVQFIHVDEVLFFEAWRLFQQLRSFIIPFPQPEERACIAEILDTVDEAIARTSSLIIKLKQTKAGLWKDWNYRIA
jgi:type I restriction enzyme S subunit